MRHLGIVASSAPQAFAPTVSVSSVTNFNQNRGTFNGTVSANGAITTTIKFQISLNNSTWFDAVGGTTITNTSSQSISVFYNATGYNNGGTVNLLPATLYYVRLVATNAAGTTNSSSTSFTTWRAIAYSKTTTGTESFTIPTITPTGGTVIAPSILNLFIIGGGGGGSLAGGGGATSNNPGTVTCASGSNTTISVTVGVGGTAGTWDGTEENSTNGGSGGSSSVSGAITTYTAAGGLGGQKNVLSSGAAGGNSGSGNAGGSSALTVDGKGGIAYGGGGGGGNGGVGGNATAASVTTGYGGQGGAGSTGGGYTFGGGGYGGGTNGNYGNGTNYGGYGYGGNYVTAGGPGIVSFTYYGV